MNDTRQQPGSSSLYTTRLNQTLRALQDQVREQEAVLAALRDSTVPLETEPSSDSRAHLKQLRCLAAAYRSLTSSEPYLPLPDSLLPSLIALRNTSDIIRETQLAIRNSECYFTEATKRLEKEKSDLEDAKTVQTAILARTASLNDDMKARIQKPQGQISKDLMQEMMDKKSRYDKETKKLVEDFNDFIDDYLAPMLAVEELGGPIVGQIVNVGEENLETTFSTQGKAKKLRLNEEKRQMRIDNIWGERPRKEEKWDEKRAAAAEMRNLTELLLNSQAEVQGNGPGAYVEIPRESAASRFLVRSKVAQFHPKDANKLRLIDFGGGFDD